MRKIYALLAAALAFGVSLPAMGQTAEKNLIVCGDASTCPNQRGTTAIGGDIAGTATMTMDYWTAKGGASSAINISVSTPGSLISGVTKSMRFQRKAANTDVVAIHLGQVFDTDVSTFLQGKTVCWNFNVESGANFSANLATLTYTMTFGTGAAQGYSSMVAGTWTGTGTVMTGTATVATLPQNVSKCAAVPATATEIGIDYSYVPVGTAGAADFVDIMQTQVEAVNSPPASAQPTPYSFRTLAQEFNLAARRAYVINEPAANVNVKFTGTSASATSCIGTLDLPIQMRAAPTLTASAIVAGTNWMITAAGVAANTSAVVTVGANTVLNASMNWTTAGMTAGQACLLQGKGGTATLTWSADLT